MGASRLFADAGLLLSLTEIRLAAMVAAAVVLVRRHQCTFKKKSEYFYCDFDRHKERWNPNYADEELSFVSGGRL